MDKANCNPASSTSLGSFLLPLTSKTLMLSYRHGYHAGNHADVLKHLCQVLILDYLNQKQNKAYCYIDTHAGAASYPLKEGFAVQNREFDTGISKLWAAPQAPAEVERYLDCVRALNPSGEMAFYPGSPAFARHLMARENHLHLFELHPKEFPKLQTWAGRERRIKCDNSDGFKGLIAKLPPLERRALVVIDPPYEVKDDYLKVKEVLLQAHKRFATGVYMVWLPLLNSGMHETLLRQLKKLGFPYLLAQFLAEPASSNGMYGSAVYVMNPPWLLEQQLRSALPYLQQQLSSVEKDAWSIEAQLE